jgi:hypothetical protein
MSSTVRHGKTLRDPSCKASVKARISALTPDSRRRWGRMSAHQMLCHLADSYRGVIGERAISSIRLRIPRPVLKWLVLNAPWPKNAPTRPEVDQEAGGTPPADFDADRAQLLDAIERFCAAPDSLRGPHPMLGCLTRDEWMRWGYRHAHHHLRQFGA